MHYRIMLVDDDKHILNALRRTLAADDVEVESFTEPAEALRRAQVTTFDLFLTDYRMPQMDGLRLLGELNGLQPEAARMIVSGVADFEVVVQAVNEASIHRFIAKPWNDYDLKAAVRSVLERRALEVENRRLADRLRRMEIKLAKQAAELARMEQEHPGITRVDWADDGSIRLNEEEV